MVATALTVYGIETIGSYECKSHFFKLQQPLPFTVLKLTPYSTTVNDADDIVATALTVYGIETISSKIINDAGAKVATALTVYGIETARCTHNVIHNVIQLQQPLPFTVLKHLIANFIFTNKLVATALTVYGIETSLFNLMRGEIFHALQQPLPFTVLKPGKLLATSTANILKLQQPLPFTVLKPSYFR